MSNYRIYSGDKKSLVFPILGDGYVHLDYSKHIPKGTDGVQSNSGIETSEGDDDDDAKYGLWAHKSSFTIEAIATPYDVNGFGMRLGLEHQGSGDPASGLDTVQKGIGIPFGGATNPAIPIKYFSPSGGGSEHADVDNAPSRTANYFSWMKNCELTNAPLNSSDTSFKINTVEKLVGGSYLWIDREQMAITKVIRDNGKSCTVHATRGVNGTTAVAHAANSTVYSDNRRNHKMTIFHNETCQFYLKNMTRTNMNQPAEYKIGCVMKGKDVNGNIRTVTIESDNPVITADSEIYSKPIEQTSIAEYVFGKPVYFTSEDRIQYHKIVNTSGNQIYYEGNFYGIDAISGGTNDIIFTTSTLRRTAGSWNASISEAYIKIDGSAKNDGYYYVTGISTTSSSNDTLTVSSANFTAETYSTSGGALGVYYIKNDESASGEGCFISFADGSTDTMDVGKHIWFGKNLYSQINSTGTFSTTLQQNKPTKLGFVSDIYVNGSNLSTKASIGLCKLIKPIRTTTETTLYVDDARNLLVGQKILFMEDEEMTITAIANNTVTVTRGSGPKTSSLNAYTLTSGAVGGSSYVTDAREEDDFSRIICNAEIGKNNSFSGYRLVDGSGDSISSSEKYGGHLFGDTYKECGYVLRPFHLALSYDKLGQKIGLFVDGKEVDVSLFSEGNLRISTIVGGGTTATVTTIDQHGITAAEVTAGTAWISIKSSSTNDLNGVWKVTSVTDDYTFVINIVNSNTSTYTSATITDVSLRTFLNFTDFEFDATDCYLGSNGNEDLGTRRASQFMGEIHELCITKEYKDNFQVLDTLVPNYRNVLLYFRFEGENS
jgi:hypothetical protein